MGMNRLAGMKREGRVGCVEKEMSNMHTTTHHHYQAAVIGISTVVV